MCIRDSHTGRQVRAPIDIEVLEHQLHEWLGEDWKELVEDVYKRQVVLHV